MLSGGKNPPPLYLRAELCRMFHCLPSELEKESAEIIKMASMLSIADQFRMEEVRKPQASSATLDAQIKRLKSHPSKSQGDS